MEKERQRKRKKHRWLLRLTVLAAIVAMLFLDSSFRLVSTEYELSYNNLPASFDGFRIVQLSDLHMARFGKDNERLIELVARQQPDIIALTGDIIEKRSPRKAGSQTEDLEPFLRKLVKLAPCYFISGNHEWASGELPALVRLFGELDIKYLRNEFILLGEDGEQIILAGVEDPNGPADMLKPDELVDIIRKNYPDVFTVMLAHRNDLIEKYPELSVDILLCGHAHGGVVRLPVLGGVFGTELDFFPEYDAGLYNEGGFDMVLSRGLGGFVPMPRLFNNPEVVTVILRNEA